MSENIIEEKKEVWRNWPKELKSGLGLNQIQDKHDITCPTKANLREILKKSIFLFLYEQKLPSSNDVKVAIENTNWNYLIDDTEKVCPRERDVTNIALTNSAGEYTRY